MNSHLGDAAVLLVETLFGIYILIVLLRFLLQLVRADFYNPISQFLVKATQPPLRPLRRLLPGVAGIDVASLVLLLVLELVRLALLFAIRGYEPGIGVLLVLALAELLSRALYVFFWALIIQIVISWISPGTYNPITSLLHSLTEPLVRPVRRMLPAFGGFDLSPIPVLLGLQLAQILLVGPIRGLASAM